MTRAINQPIETKVQVLDSEGDPANSATVSYKIYDETDGIFASGTMTFIADGIYSATWTPDAVGEWTVETYSANPKFRKSFAYHVEPATVADQVLEVTHNLNQVTGDYDLATASGGDVILKSVIVQNVQNLTADYALIGFSIQTDHTTPQEIITETEGYYNPEQMTADAQFAWNGTILLESGHKLQISQYLADVLAVNPSNFIIKIIYVSLGGVIS